MIRSVVFMLLAFSLEACMMEEDSRVEKDTGSRSIIDIKDPYERFAVSLKAELPDYIKAFKQAGASDGYLALVRKIGMGAVPAESELKELKNALDHNFNIKGSFTINTLLQMAVRYRNLPALESLLKAGANPNEPGFITYMLAASDPGGWQYDPVSGRNFLEHKFSLAAVKLFLQYGGNPDFRYPNNDEHVIVRALGNNNPTVALYLVENGADPWAPSSNDEPLIKDVAKYGPNEINFLTKVAQNGGFKNGARNDVIEFIVNWYAEGYERFKYDRDDQGNRELIQKLFQTILDNSKYQASDEMKAILEDAENRKNKTEPSNKK